jgi:hypothetical protein
MVGVTIEQRIYRGRVCEDSNVSCVGGWIIHVAIVVDLAIGYRISSSLQLSTAFPAVNELESIENNIVGINYYRVTACQRSIEDRLAVMLRLKDYWSRRRAGRINFNHEPARVAGRVHRRTGICSRNIGPVFENDGISCRYGVGGFLPCYLNYAQSATLRRDDAVGVIGCCGASLY